MNKKEEFKKVINLYFNCKLSHKESQRYKQAFEVLKSGSPYECCGCGNNSGLSFLEPKHNCKNPMYDKNHMPREEYLSERCKEYGFDWDLIMEKFGRLINDTPVSKEVIEDE